MIKLYPYTRTGCHAETWHNWTIVPWECGDDFKNINFKLIIKNIILVIRCEIVLTRVPQNLTNENLILVHVMAWCRHLSQYWPRFLSSYDVTWPQWVNFSRVYLWSYLGAVSIRKTVLPDMTIPMLKIRRPNGRLIFNMEIAIRR